MSARAETYRKVRAALEALLEECAAITVKGVAKRARVSRSTMYNDFALLDLVQSFEAGRQFEDGFAAGQSVGGGRGHSGEAWARGVLHIAPDETITAGLLRQKRAQLSQFLHPDKGGDTALQQTLNQAFEVLKRLAA